MATLTFSLRHHEAANAAAGHRPPATGHRPPATGHRPPATGRRQHLARWYQAALLRDFPTPSTTPFQLRIQQGMIAGLTAAAATAGALLLFGSRLGDPLQAFTAIGVPVIGRGVPLLAAGVGLLAHISVCVLWGAVLGLLVPRTARFPLPLVAAAALAVTVAAALVHGYLLLPTLRLGTGLGGPRAPVGPIVALHVVFALALILGLYVARRAAREPGRFSPEPLPDAGGPPQH